MIYVDMLAFNYGYAYEYICELDAFVFLKLIRCIQKRDAETSLANAHIACMVNANEEAWNHFKVSLGFAPTLSTLAAAASNNASIDDKAEMQKLMAFMGQ